MLVSVKVKVLVRNRRMAGVVMGMLLVVFWVSEATALDFAAHVFDA